jgi:hypothetical protein
LVNFRTRPKIHSSPIEARTVAGLNPHAHSIRGFPGKSRLHVLSREKKLPARIDEATLAKAKDLSAKGQELLRTLGLK